MDRFNICQAYAQLEADYNVGGWLRERPSNQRRNESIGVQLHRMGFSNPYGYVTICREPDWREDDFDVDQEVREVYFRAVLRLNLPIDADLMTAIRHFFTPEFLAKYPQCAGNDYRQR